jgi:hypothetical protein
MGRRCRFVAEAESHIGTVHEAQQRSREDRTRLVPSGRFPRAERPRYLQFLLLYTAVYSYHSTLGCQSFSGFGDVQ